MAAVGAVAGSAASLVFGSSLEAVLYGVQTTDALSFAGAAGALLATTTVAALVPAIRATRMNPTEVLRGD